MSLSEQQERFCQLIVQGKNQTDAYMEAGYKVKDAEVAKSAASRLFANVNIVARVAELRASSVDDTIVTLEWLKEQAKGILKEAREAKQFAAATGALKELGILSGERVEKSVRENINRDADQLTEAELAAYLAPAGSAGIAEPKAGAPKPH
jgi:phage terminase small subunit